MKGTEDRRGKVALQLESRQQAGRLWPVSRALRSKHSSRSPGFEPSAAKPEREADQLELFRIGAEAPRSGGHAVLLEQIRDDVGVLTAREAPWIIAGHRGAEVIEQLERRAAAPAGL